MSSNLSTAFQPRGNTVRIDAAPTAPLGVQCPISSIGLDETGQIRVVNNGSSVVYLGVGSSATEAQSNATAASPGSPASGIPLMPGSVEVLRFPPGSYFSASSASTAVIFITPGVGI